MQSEEIHGGRSEGWRGGLMLPPLPKGGGGTKISWSASQSVTATSGLIVEEHSTTTTSLLVPRREGRSDKRRRNQRELKGSIVSSITLLIHSDIVWKYVKDKLYIPIHSRCLPLIHLCSSFDMTCIFHVWLFSVKYSQKVNSRTEDSILCVYGHFLHRQCIFFHHYLPQCIYTEQSNSAITPPFCVMLNSTAAFSNQKRHDK